jgi:hypothetical protein
MNIRCANDWLFHDWGKDGKCTRCDVTGLNLRVPAQTDATSEDDQSRVVVPLRVRLAGLAFQHGLRLHRR